MIAAVLTIRTFPSAGPAPAHITLVGYARELTRDIERLRVRLAAYPGDAQKAEAEGQ